MGANYVDRVVSLSKAHLLPTVLVKPRKRWLRPDMTEKLLTGTLSLNTNKQTNYVENMIHASTTNTDLRLCLTHPPCARIQWPNLLPTYFPT